MIEVGTATAAPVSAMYIFVMNFNQSVGMHDRLQAFDDVRWSRCLNRFSASISGGFADIPYSYAPDKFVDDKDDMKPTALRRKDTSRKRNSIGHPATT